jgi:hypothetical protein
MSFNFGGSDKKQSGTMASTTNPWAPTQPYLTDFLGRLGTAGASLGQITPGQSTAYADLAGNAGRAGQFTPDIEALTRDLFRTESTAPMATDAYRRLEQQLGGFASGERIDPMADPNLRTMLDTIGSDAANRINAMFAGAGRDLSPEHSQAVTRGVTQATAPILVDTYNRNVDRHLGAAQALYGAGRDTAVTTAGLDDAALATRERGIQTAQAALESLNLPANMRLEIERQLQTLPVEQLGLVAQQLFAAAGLGGQTTGKQSQSSSGSSWGIGLKWPSAA